MRILIVDDDEIVHMLITRLLGKAGFSGHEFADAADGITAYQKICEWKPGLVLSDWRMAGMTGLELLQKLRAEGNPVPFGFITTMANVRETETAVSSGALFLVKKPVSAATLRSLLAGIL